MQNITQLTNLTAAWTMFRSYAERRPWQTTLIVAMILLAGMAESFGLLSLLPLLAAFSQDGARTLPSDLEEQSDALEMMVDAFALIGLNPTFDAALFVLVCAMMVKVFLVAGADIFVAHSAVGLILERRTNLLVSIGQAQWAYFVEHPIGRLTNIVSREIDKAASGIVRSLQMLSLLVQVLVLLLASFLVSWEFTLFAGMVAGVVALLLNRFVNRARAAGKQRTIVTTKMMDSLVDGFQGFKALKSMARERALIRLLTHDATLLKTADVRQRMAKIFLDRLLEAIVVLMVGVFVYAAISFGGVGLSEVLVTAAMGYRAVNRIGDIQKILQKIVANYQAFQLIEKTQEQAAALKEELNGTRVPVFEREILFDTVSFAYYDTPVLDAIDLVVPSKGLTALIGPSGAGKSTIVDLMLGLRHTPKGRILIDGVPIQDISIQAWRSMIGYVPQDVRLFDRSIFKNVALDEPSLGREDVERALRQAGAWEWVSSLPDGIDSPLGQGGQLVSGGQRQRIALARALAHRPKLLLLDEATSALDPETEARICETLRKIATETSVLAISHQTGIQKIADTVYRIEAGRIQMIDRSVVEPIAAPR
ncbi:MAG: ATP-binding cassette domain-containing protein [Alphaproteobacteria bacterium]|nr:ATP-binding cassette domain-containing protein [Alphaproteobacteria bacterium]